MSLQFIHSGSTLLNMALTGHPRFGWPLGRMSNVIGDKSTGKTLVAIEAMQMALVNPPAGIKDMQVAYMEAEAAFDREYAEVLGLDPDAVQFCDGTTIEEFSVHLNNVLDNTPKGGGSLFIVDSLDALESAEELKKDIDEGSYNMAKQKRLGKILARSVRAMEDCQMHLMFISQIRENITTLPFAPKWRRAGGKAMDFYASHLVWLAETGKFKDKKTNLVYGVDIKAKVTKNKVARPFREVAFPILFEFGIDDIYAMLTWLAYSTVPEQYRVATKKAKWKMYNWCGAEYTLTDLMEHIEDNAEDYTQLVARAYGYWNHLEDAVTQDRTRKTGLVSAVDWGAVDNYGDPTADAEGPDVEGH